MTIPFAKYLLNEAPGATTLKDALATTPLRTVTTGPVVIDDGGAHSNAQAAIVTCANGDVLAFCAQGIGINVQSSIKQFRLVSGDSPTDPTKWLSGTSPKTIAAYNFIADRTPAGVNVTKLASGRLVLFFDALTGTGILDGQAGNLSYVMHSDDHGVTWSTPVQVNPGFAYPTSSFYGSPHQLPGATILMPFYGGETAAVWQSQASGVPQLGTYVRLMRSTDDGATWSYYSTMMPSTPGNNYSETQLIRLPAPDGRLMAIIRTQQIIASNAVKTFYKSFSSDNGLTWTTPIRTLTPGANNPGALDHVVNGTELFVFSREAPDPLIGSVSPGFFSGTNDGGVRWSQLTRMDPVGHLGQIGAGVTEFGTGLLIAQCEGDQLNSNNKLVIYLISASTARPDGDSPATLVGTPGTGYTLGQAAILGSAASVLFTGGYADAPSAPIFRSLAHPAKPRIRIEAKINPNAPLAGNEVDRVIGLLYAANGGSTSDRLRLLIKESFGQRFLQADVNGGVFRVRSADLLLATGVPHEVACELDDTTLKLFLDDMATPLAVTVGGNGAPQQIDSNSFQQLAFRIGAGRSGDPFTGFITEVEVIGLPQIVSTSLPGGLLNAAYNRAVQVEGGSQVYTWALTAGALPAGLALNTSTGVISGTANTLGTSSFTITVTDSNGWTDVQAYTVTISTAIQITLAVQSANIHTTVGVPISEAANLLSLSSLRVRNPAGAVIPYACTVTSRWGGLAGDTTKPIKWLLVDFYPTATGVHSLDDSAATPVANPTLTVTDAADVRVQTATLDVRIPKSGTNLLTQWLSSAVERLAATKPTLETPVSLQSFTTWNAGQDTTKPVAAPVGQNKITVDDGTLFTVGQQVKIQWAAKYNDNTTGDINLNNAPDNYGIWYQIDTSPLRRFIFARGTARQFILTAFAYFYGDFNQIHRSSGDGFPSNLLAGDTVEDYDAFLDNDATPYTISGISGNELTLNRNLGAQVLKGAVVSIIGASAAQAKLQIQSAVIEEQNALRTIIKQSGYFGVPGRVFPDLTAQIRYYFYANSTYARVRVRLLNNTTDVNHTVQPAVLAELKLAFPTAAAATASDDSVLVLNGPNSACARVLANTNPSTAAAGAFKLSVAEFAEKFPQRLIGAASLLTWYIFPPQTGVTYQFHEDWAATWDAYLGDGADAGLPITTLINAIVDPAQFCTSLAVRRQLVTKRTWNAGDFQGNTVLAEAANRAEDMFAVGYDLSRVADASLLGAQARMTLFEYRLSSHTQTGGLQDMGPHFGWDIFGNIRSDVDGFTFNRYDTNFSLLREYVRSGDLRAYRLGAEHSRYMADGGTIQSDINQGGNVENKVKGVNRYERSPQLTVGVQTPRPTHSWGEGVWLYWALTGDPIAHETALLHRQAGLAWNYQGAGYTGPPYDGWLEYDEARGTGWAILEVMNGYRYNGNVTDLVRAKQYVDHLRLSEESQGSHGFYKSPSSVSGGSAGSLRPISWCAYPIPGMAEYLREKRALGAADTTNENFLVRIADWLMKGDSQLGAPGNDLALVGGTTSGGLYKPWQLKDDWWNSDPALTAAADAYVASADLAIICLILGARLTGRGDLRARADDLFKDVCFYRDTNANISLDPATRTPINFRNWLFRSTSAKVWSQTGLALSEYIPDAIVNAPTPTINTISPTNGPIGVLVTLTVAGTGFIAGTVINFNGTNYTPTSLTITQAVVDIPSTAVPSSGNYPVFATNTNGQSASVTFTVNPASNPVPTLTSISPATVAAGSAQFTMMVIGTNFINSSVVKWGATNLATTFVDGTHLSAIVPANLLTAAGSAAVTVFNPTPGGGTSAAQTFTISAANNPVPVITSSSPAIKLVGDPQFTLTVNGSNFVAGSMVMINGVARPTSYVGPGQLTATIPATDLQTAGTLLVSVFNPTPGGGTSQASQLLVNNPAPVLASIAPAAAVAGAGQFTLVCNGSGFIAGSVVRWNGSDIVTSFVSSGQLSAIVPAPLVAAIGSAAVTVFSPTPGGGTSGPQTFTISPAPNPTPILSNISPTNKLAGDPQFTLTVNGSQFVAGAVVRVGGVDRVTTYVSPTQLTAVIPASDVLAVGQLVVTVFNPSPGGGTSAAATLTVSALPPPVITTISPTSATAGAAALTLTVTGTGFSAGSVVRVNSNNRATTYINAATLTIQLTTGDLSAPASLSITVLNPDAQVSVASIFTVNPVPAPILSNIAPTNKVAGDAQFTLTVNGTQFAANAVVRVNGVDHTTAFVSASQLTAIIPATDLLVVAQLLITVFNPGPGGGVSGAATLTVAALPGPVITSISPTTSVAGAAAQTLTITGTGFLAGSIARVNGNSRATTYVNASTLTIQLTTNDQLAAGALAITVINPDTQLSAAATFTVSAAPNPAATVSSISPTSVTSGAAQFTLSVVGTGFIASSIVRVNGVDRATTFLNSTNLTAIVSAADIQQAGTKPITVFNPAPGGGVSASATLTIIQALAALRADMTPAKATLQVRQGATYSKLLRVVWQGLPVDLTGATAELQVRDQNEALLFSLDTPGGGLVIDGAAGTITIRIPATQAFTWRRGFYDLLVRSSDSLITVALLEGDMRIKKSVTIWS